MLTDTNLIQETEGQMEHLADMFDVNLNYFLQTNTDDMDVSLNVIRDRYGIKHVSLVVDKPDTLINIGITIEHYRFFGVPSWTEAAQNINVYRFNVGGESALISYLPDPIGMWNKVIELAENILDMPIEEISSNKIERL
jgi:hypothetical protein